jgi:hypothetical protein
MRATLRIVVGLALLVTVHPIAAQQPPAASQDDTLRAEVNAFMTQYWELWSTGNIDQLVARIYHPMGQVNNTGHSTIDQMKSRFPETRKSMVSKGYGRSNMPVRNICILSPTVAMVSGRGVRYLTDGKVMAEFGWTYTLIKGESGWKMVSIYTHDAGKAVLCER